MPPASLNSLSPAELAFLHSSLSSALPIRPDGRTSSQFRPLIAETNILPGVYGSARICFADGTEALVGVKAKVEKNQGLATDIAYSEKINASRDSITKEQSNNWVEVRTEIPGYRDDDSLPVFLSALLHESIVAGGELSDKLWINSRWHWKILIDALLLSPPLSYPLPLLSLTIHLALISCKLPTLKSEADEDPYFDDDWGASNFLYQPGESTRPSFTLLVAVVGPNILFDPSREEIAVSDSLLAVSLSSVDRTAENTNSKLKILSIRTIDPPAKSSSAGVPNSQSDNPPTLESYKRRHDGDDETAQNIANGSLWVQRKGGIPRRLISRVIDLSIDSEGVSWAVLAALGTAGSE